MPSLAFVVLLARAGSQRYLTGRTTDTVFPFPDTSRPARDSILHFPGEDVKWSKSE